MRSKENSNAKEKKCLIQCLRCNRRSYVLGVAKCKYCDSFSVKLLAKKKDE
jgi:ribosomal protein L37E